MLHEAAVDGYIIFTYVSLCSIDADDDGAGSAGYLRASLSIICSSGDVMEAGPAMELFFMNLKDI